MTDARRRLASHWSGSDGVPGWVLVPAGVGALLVVLPVVALVTRADFAGFWGLVTAPGARDALWLSLRTSAAATGLCLLLGVPMALVLARFRFPGRRLARALVLLPLVLPPVVGGLALLTLLGRRGLLGEVLPFQVPFTTAAAVVAQTFVALPFLVLTLEGALRTLDTAHEDVAATLAARPARILRVVTLPRLRPALASGTVLAFARALGEFGATLTFAGALQGVTQTLPLEIYLARSADPDAAVALSLVLVVVALAIIVAAHGPWPTAREPQAGVEPAGAEPAADAGRRPATALPGYAPPTAKTPPAAVPLHVRVRVPERGVDITLDVAPGEVVALLGPNGAGKSTLLQAVAGLLDPGRGEVAVALGDRVLTDTAAGIRVPARDRGVGWLGQRALLLDNLTVLDNVAFGPVSRGSGRATARAAAARQLEAVGAEHVAGRHPRELSGGLAQRVAVARALATEPAVLLVDEPFAALDVDSVAQVRALLRATHDAAPRTTLLVTHDAADVAALADRVVVLDRGRVVEDGPADRVLARPESPFARRLLSPSAPR